MKYKSMNQFNPMYMPQQIYQTGPNHPQMRQQVQMMPQPFSYPQGQNFYPVPMMGGIQNTRVTLQAAPMPVMNFRSGHDINKRKEEFKKLPKQNRQEILKGILIGKLKTNKNPEL